MRDRLHRIREKLCRIERPSELWPAFMALVGEESESEEGSDRQSFLDEANAVYREVLEKFLDPLTGLYTHTAFHEELTARLQSSERNGSSLVVVFLDLDHFRDYNEQSGHARGDDFLSDFAETLVEVDCPEHLAFRYGGDEFAVIRTSVSKEDMLQWAESMRLRTESSNDVVTLSVGVACFPSDARSRKDLVKAADDALYVAKRGGRNQVAASGTLEERQVKPIIVEERPHDNEDDDPPAGRSGPRKPPPPDLSGGGAERLP